VHLNAFPHILKCLYYKNPFLRTIHLELYILISFDAPITKKNKYINSHDKYIYRSIVGHKSSIELQISNHTTLPANLFLLPNAIDLSNVIKYIN